MKLGPSLFARVVLFVACFLIGGLIVRELAVDLRRINLSGLFFALSLAALLLSPYKFWPAIFSGTLLFSFVGGSTFEFSALGIALGNAATAMISAFLLKRLGHFENSMERLRDVAGFVTLACLLGAGLNVFVHLSMLPVSDAVFSRDLLPAMLQFWVPNALAVLVVSSLMLVWIAPSSIRWNKGLFIEALLCATGLVAGTFLSLNSWTVSGAQTYPLAYLPYPFLVWATLRFGQRGATAGTFLVAAVVLPALYQGLGPFAAGSGFDSLILVGSYIGIPGIGNLFLAAAIAERERARQRANESEKRYRAIVEDQIDLICRFDLQGRITFVNHAYCLFHDKPPEDLIGTPFMPSLSIEDQEIPLSYFATLTPKKPSLTFDDKLLAADGKFAWQQCTIHALFDEHGRAQEYQSVLHDITDRKQLEDSLRESEEFFRLISENMTDLIVVLDRRGKRIYSSPSYAAVVGGTLASNGEEPFLDVHPDDRESVRRIFKETLYTGISQRAEFRLARKDGTIRFVESHFNAIRDKGGQPAKVAVLSRDITERLSYETKLRQSQKMEAIGRLAGGISHDFNNLMQAIIGYTNLLLQRLPAADANRDTIVQVEKSADRAAALTAQLLAFSRKQVLKPKVFSLDEVVADVNKLLRRLIGENIQIVNRPGEKVGNVCADPGQIEQVILNLSLNARDAMPQGGTLSISTSNVEIGDKADGFSEEFQPGSYVRLSLTDTGSGMSDEVKAHLFEPFFTTKAVGKGTGLGLSIVYGIVKQSGGEITVESEIGKGTTFHVLLPRVVSAIVDAPAITPAPPAQNTKGTETILLVEDEEIVRGMFSEVLQAKGYTVIEAKHGANALDLAASHVGPIDLVITDMLMPEMNGWELAGRLLTLRPELPVLYISGYSDDEARRMAKFDEAAEFLQKPFRPDALLSRARQILDAKKEILKS